MTTGTTWLEIPSLKVSLPTLLDHRDQPVDSSRRIASRATVQFVNVVEPPGAARGILVPGFELGVVEFLLVARHMVPAKVLNPVSVDIRGPILKM